MSPSGNPAILLGRAYSKNEAAQALADSAAAYADLAARACTPAPLGNTLTPGIYCVASSLQLPQTLTLDAGGNKDAVWSIKIAGALTVPPNVAVRVINGGYDGNVYWQVAGSAALGDGSTVVGTILALNDISLAHGATLSGRALAQRSVTMDDSNVSICCQPVAVSPSSLPVATVGKAYSQNFAANGGLRPYTFVSTQPLPPGLTASGNVLSGIPTTAGTYALQVTAVDQHGCPGVQLYKLTVNGIPALPSLPPVVCVPTNVPIIVTGGTPPYTFTTTPLPAGFSLSPAGVLSVTAPGCATFTVTVTDSIGASASLAYTICGMVVLPTALPDGTVGEPYDQPITASGGTAPYACTFSGSLPPGLTLSGCTITGIPTTVGCTPFTVTVTDATGFSCSRTYTLCIKSCPLVISPATLPDGVIGVPYAQTITATGGTAPYICSVSSGLLPPGLAVANCTISGVPTAPGCYTFTETVTDSTGLQCSRTYTICIKSCSVAILPPPPPNGIAGSPYNYQFAANGGTPPYMFALISGTLPPLLTLSPSGLLSGTPTTAGGYAFTVRATDLVGCFADASYTVVIKCPTITINPATLPAGSAGTAYAQMITASGGTAPYVFTLASGALPPGLALAPGGALSGLPTTPGVYCFSVSAIDAHGCAGGPVAYTLIINAASCPGTSIILSPNPLPTAYTGLPYAQLITPAGGTPPYTFAVTSGALPPGLFLNGATGMLAGIPTTSGIYTFTITVTDANGCVGTLGCGVVMPVDIPALSPWEMLMLCIVLAAVGWRSGRA